MLSFVHYLLLLLLIISHFFQTLLLNTYSYSHYHTTVLMFIYMLLLFALLFVRLIIKIACTIGINPILLSFLHESKTWTNYWLIDWKKTWTFDILAAEYQFVRIVNSVSIVKYCKDIELFFIHKFADWFFDLHNK